MTQTGSSAESRAVYSQAGIRHTLCMNSVILALGVSES
eukprot:CAMPEP_0169148254 /NCGR_PEP_ID=MMETSP1015-20121227/48747_1 /TAXON_ID=342587 /ORGANISM="Karlodinium micrum, Strain CCMP2283" /LENGTH=37 /DNA_ID= /DNA_START= /DNA_END= /DNA_ORIENTATION=